jgi:hypothetical protein
VVAGSASVASACSNGSEGSGLTAPPEPNERDAAVPAEPSSVAADPEKWTVFGCVGEYPDRTWSSDGACD